MQKNVAGQTIKVFAFNAITGLPVPGDAANITAQIKKDGGALGGLSGPPIDLGGGDYLFTATQANSNANVVDVVVSSSTADVVVFGSPSRIITTPPNYADGALATAAGLGTAQSGITDIKAQTDQQVYTVANQLDVNVKSVDGNAAVVAMLQTIFGSSIQIGVVGSGIHTNVLIASSDVTGPLDNALAKSVLQFINGNNSGRKALISGNTAATGSITLEVGFELLTAPADGDIFIIP